MRRREFLRTCARCGVACALWQVPGFLPVTNADWGSSLTSLTPMGTATALAAGGQDLTPRVGYIAAKRSPYFTALSGGTVQCTLCPRTCVVPPGGRGHCEVRENRDGVLVSLTYGNPCAVNVDPIEKKPFMHVLPGSRSFSIATAGCNLDCKFCQNWEISQARPDDTANLELPPEAVVALAKEHGCLTIASTYVEPTIFMEYMLDVARLAQAQGLRKVMHSCGYVNAGPLDDLCTHLDAACIDLKGFTEAYYQDVTGGTLAPVLESLKRLKANGVFTELVNLVLPGKNDGEAEIRAMSRWIVHNLGPDTPLHFSRFFPRYKLMSLPPTPVETLERARAVAMEEGLRYVYLGNLGGHPATNTYCPQCHATVIRRVGYQIELSGFTDGHCAACGQSIPGIWS